MEEVARKNTYTRPSRLTSSLVIKTIDFFTVLRGYRKLGQDCELRN
jgi:hypothetical protein